MPKALSIREALATVSLAILCPIESVAQNHVLPLVVPFQPRDDGRADQAVEPNPTHLAHHSGLRSVDSWSNIQVDDAYVRDAATRALDGASRWLARPKCRTLFEEVKDQRGLPLATKLRELDTDPVDYLRMVRFLDGGRSTACNRHGVLAFTRQGSRVVYLCGREFERAWRRDVAEAEATVIHELLHSLGAGENPPSPRAINYRIRQLCW